MPSLGIKASMITLSFLVIATWFQTASALKCYVTSHEDRNIMSKNPAEAKKLRSERRSTHEDCGFCLHDKSYFDNGHAVERYACMDGNLDPEQLKTECNPRDFYQLSTYKEGSKKDSTFCNTDLCNVGCDERYNDGSQPNSPGAPNSPPNDGMNGPASPNAPAPPPPKSGAARTLPPCGIIAFMILSTLAKAL